MNIVIVEDEIFSANRLKNLLEKHEMTVTGIFDNGAEAIRFCRRTPPDVVLMDILLRGRSSGIDAAETIRQEIPQIAVVFLTAYSDAEVIEYASRTGAAGYLLKPYREGEIVATLQLIQNRLTAEPSCPTPDDSRLLLRGEYVFDLTLETLLHGEDEVPLSPNSRKLLSLLCRNRGVFLESRKILEYIWEDAGTMDRLRSLIYRLNNTTTLPLIENQNRIGYRIILREKPGD